MWQSSRDFAQQIDCCLRDETVECGVYSGVRTTVRGGSTSNTGGL